MKSSFDGDHLKSSLKIPSVIPESINARIDDTLRNLEQKKKNRKLPKKTFMILVACITISSLSALAAFGQNLPILNSLVNFVNPSAAKNYETVKVAITDKKGKTIVNKKITDQGIALTVNDLSYDGATLIVGYNLSKPGGFGNDVTQIDTDLMPRFQSLKDGTPSGRGNQPSTQDSYLSKKDNGDYQGYASINFGDPDTKIRDDYTLSLAASNIGLNGPSGFKEVNGLWKIDTGLTEKDIYTAAQTTESNVVHEFKNGKVDSVKVIRSALSNIISFKGTDNIKQIPNLRLGFFILDDKGNCMNYRSLSMSSDINGDGGFKTGMSLLRIPNDTKKLTVIPYRYIFSKIDSDYEKLYKADLAKLPVSIKIQDQEINISAIERSSGKLIMHFTIIGLADDISYTSFGFEDKKGNKILPNEPWARIISPVDYETHQGTYEFRTDHPEEISKVTVYGHEYELMNDYKFDIEMK